MFTGEANRWAHYQKHVLEEGNAGGDYADVFEYEAAADAIVNGDYDEMGHHIDGSGSKVYWKEATQQFVVTTADGKIITMFAPERGKDYFYDNLA